MTTEPESAHRGFFADLFHRRVPQYFGAYILGTIAVLEGVQWVQEQYLLSDHVNHLAGVLALSLVPTILVLAYEHGAPGKQAWTRPARLLLLICLLIPVVALGSQIRRGDFSKVTETVTVTGEDGSEIERQVPKAEYRRKIALFAFENGTGDPDRDWLNYALPSMIHYDLLQDVFISSYSWFFTPEEFAIAEKARFDPARPLPLGLQRQVAEVPGAAFLISGRFEVEGSTLIVEVDIVNAKTGKTIETTTLREKDIWDVIDAASLVIKNGIGIPAVAIEGTTDLPVEEISTADETALRLFWEGMFKKVMGDSSGGIELVGTALETDPTFAMGHYNMAIMRFLDNQMDRAKANIIAARAHRYKLPERIVYYTDAMHAFHIEENIGKAYAIYHTLTRLYPFDILARWNLVNNLLFQNKRAEAMEELTAILEMDPGDRKAIALLGRLYQANEAFGEAERIYRDLVEKYPENSDGWTLLGDFYQDQGRFDEAEQAYDRASAIDPDRFDLLLKRAEGLRYIGDFDEARTVLTKAQNLAGNLQEEIELYSGWVSFFRTLGQFRKALEQNGKIMEISADQNAFYRLMTNMNAIEIMLEGGQVDQARALLETLRAEFTSPLDRVVLIGDIWIGEALGDATAMERALMKLRAFVEENQAFMAMSYVDGAQGSIHEVRGDWEQALPIYEALCDNSPNNAEYHRSLARVLRGLDRFTEAEQRLNRARELNPSDPETFLEAAYLYQAMGNRVRAETNLNAALEIWSDADEDYIPATRARALRETLGDRS